MAMHLFLIDAIGPFFRGYERRTINWSKIPFDHLKLDGPRAAGPVGAHPRRPGRLCAKAAALGFNAVSLDDVTHLADHAWYELETRARISRWRAEFRRCFDVVRKHGLQIFLTMDVFSSTPDVREHLAKLRRSVESFLAEQLDAFLAGLPGSRGRHRPHR